MKMLRKFMSPDGVWTWKRAALVWGAFMFLSWQAYRALKGQEITPQTLVFDLVLWSLAALAWGRLTVFLANRRAKV